MNLISVIVEAPEEEGDEALAYDLESLGPTRGGTRSAVRGRRRGAVQEMDVSKLQTSFAALSEQVSTILQDVRKVGDFRLKTVQLKVEVSSEGGVQLVGSLKAGVAGAISLTFEAAD